MTGDASDAAADCWGFALKVYAEPGVSAACLRLQAEAGVDVMMLLAAGFAAARHRVILTRADIEDMNAVCRAWREHIVGPLRALRTTLKAYPAPDHAVAISSLRSRIKSSELAAERIESDMLSAWLLRRPAALAPRRREEIGAIVCDVVCHASGDPRRHEQDDIRAAIGIVLGAIMKVSSPDGKRREFSH